MASENPNVERAGPAVFPLRVEDVRIQPEPDREVREGYQRGPSHVEVFKVTDASGAWLTELLFNADSEVWTIEPDEIWSADAETLMDVLRLFVNRSTGDGADG